MRSIGIVGSGQMGRGIAQVAAQHGLKVVMVDESKALAEAGVGLIGTGLTRLVERGTVDADQYTATMSRLRAGDAIGDLADCDIVIEAAPEDDEIKFAIFRELDRVCSPWTILASNTSSIPIAWIASVTGRPDRVIGMHFMNPVPVMQLVEVIRGEGTSDETAATIHGLAADWGKTTIESTDTAGFIVNRILLPFLNEAYIALEQGVGTVQDIDRGARLGLNHPMGPLELSDHVGLDTCLAVLEVLYRDLGHDRYRPAEILKQYVAEGRLGKKSGAGFYDYDERGVRQ